MEKQKIVRVGDVLKSKAGKKHDEVRRKMKKKADEKKADEKKADK